MSLTPIIKSRLRDTTQSQVKLGTVDLQQMLLDMQRYGRPRISCHSDNTWTCVLDVSISQIGAKFEVCSEFCTHTTPVSAAIQCNERVHAAIANLKVTQ